jgi:hypothetical protein
VIRGSAARIALRLPLAVIGSARVALLPRDLFVLTLGHLKSRRSALRVTPDRQSGGAPDCHTIA